MSWRSCQGYSSWEEWWMCWVRFWDQVCWAHQGGGFSGLGSACCRASFLLFLFFDNFIYYFLAVRVLRCCQGFPSMQRAGALVWHGLLIAWPLSAEHRHGLGLVGFITAARGLSRRGSRLWSTGSVGVVHSLSCFSALGSSWMRGRACASCIVKRLLYHWATREAPCFVFNVGVSFFSRRKDYWKYSFFVLIWCKV